MPPQASCTSTTRAAKTRPGKRSFASSPLVLDATLPPLTSGRILLPAAPLLIVGVDAGIALANRLERPLSVG